MIILSDNLNDKLEKSKTKKYQSLITSVGDILQKGRKRAFKSVNFILIRTYWEIGKLIVEYEQNGKEKAEYGKIF